jgi:hypothetical protein
MERGGIKILPIATKDVRNELCTHSTTFTRPTRLVVLQLILTDGKPVRILVFVVIASSWYDYRLGSMEPNLAKRFIKMLSL